jgi:hypothetical protein
MFTPYEHRYVDFDPELPVEVYRNTNRKGVVYTIRQLGYVVAHANEVNLVNAEFYVSQPGRKRVKKTGRKNVHAWIRGELIATRGISERSRLFQVVYNPKLYKEFRRLDTKKPIKAATFVMLNEQGVFCDNSVNL